MLSAYQRGFAIDLVARVRLYPFSFGGFSRHLESWLPRAGRWLEGFVKCSSQGGKVGPRKGAKMLNRISTRIPGLLQASLALGRYNQGLVLKVDD